ncbi:MAG: polyprenyl synthetase family protein, partial [Candidatus Staskawiczbacteria bacterium]
EIKEAKAPFLIETLKTLKEYSLRPGKRIRAILINYGYFLAGGKDKKVILKTSIFIELIHNFLLIHDDILDQDGMRRGKLSLHRLYQKNAAVKNRKEKEYYGVSMSIVAGDMMEFLGRKILSQSKFSDKHKVRAIEKLNQILISTAHGEMFEYWLRKNKTKKIAKEKDVFEIYKNKTAYYTFVGPLQIGALLAGSSDKSLFLFEKIGLPLGIAFQIKDDIEDAKSDIKEEQPNLLSFKNIDECKELAKNLTNQAKKEILITNFPIKEKQFLLDLADYIRDK